MKITLIPLLAVCAASAFARTPNYDESKVGPYTLEDPLVFVDGRKVASPADWEARRTEILGIFAREMYGVEPPAPEALVITQKSESVALGGFALRTVYGMSFRKDASGPSFDWTVWRSRYAKGKARPILLLNYDGSDCFEKKWAEVDNRTYVPLPYLIERGYAVVTARYTDVSPDVGNETAYTGVFDLWGKRDPARKDHTTALGAWAWALSRGRDLIGRLPELDAEKTILTGYSRLGKAALIAAARDTRFAVTVPVQTGGGGVPLAKRNFGENIGTEVKSFPHWYCRAYDKYADREDLLTFDQHLFVASIAPRKLLVLGYDEGWFDAKGEWLSCRAAAPVWKFLGKGTMPAVPFPDDYDLSAIGADFGYARRTEEHGIAAWDWARILDFAGR